MYQTCSHLSFCVESKEHSKWEKKKKKIKATKEKSTKAVWESRCLPCPFIPEKHSKQLNALMLSTHEKSKSFNVHHEASAVKVFTVSKEKWMTFSFKV